MSTNLFDCDVTEFDVIPPKEKAIELINKFKYDFYRYYVASSDEVPFAKIGALISIDYILSSISEKEHLIYWAKVKQEIEKL